MDARLTEAHQPVVKQLKTPSMLVSTEVLSTFDLLGGVHDQNAPAESFATIVRISGSVEHI